MEKLENKVISAICYFVSTTPIILVAVLLIINFNNSDYVKFHANQGLILFVTSFIIMFFINVILDLPFMFNTVLYVIAMAIIFWGIVNSFMGRTKEIPIIGKIDFIKN
jgi:uncharacterized membrane protein